MTSLSIKYRTILVGTHQQRSMYHLTQAVLEERWMEGIWLCNIGRGTSGEYYIRLGASACDKQPAECPDHARLKVRFMQSGLFKVKILRRAAERAAERRCWTWLVVGDDPIVWKDQYVRPCPTPDEDRGEILTPYRAIETWQERSAIVSSSFGQVGVVLWHSSQ